MWFRLAHELGMPLQQIQQETTSSEFAEWLFFLSDDYNTPSRTDMYLVQLATEVRRIAYMFATNPPKLSFDEFILKFKKPESERPLTEEEMQQRAEYSRSVWTSWLAAQKGNHVRPNAR